jgi:hypothetical protein
MQGTKRALSDAWPCLDEDLKSILCNVRSYDKLFWPAEQPPNAIGALLSELPAALMNGTQAGMQPQQGIVRARDQVLALVPQLPSMHPPDEPHSARGSKLQKENVPTKSSVLAPRPAVKPNPSAMVSK